MILRFILSDNKKSFS